MTKHQEILFSLLCDELWGTKSDIGEMVVEDCSIVIRLANEQSLSGLIFNSLIKHNIKIGIRNIGTALATIQELRQMNKKMNSAVSELADLFKRNDIPYVVFKGQTVGVNYPNPDLRAPGDIDFYVPATHYKSAKAFIEKYYGVNFENDITDMHDTFVYQEIVHEMHFRMESFGSSKHQRYYDQLIDKCIKDESCHLTINGENVNVLPSVLNIIQVFKHLFHHLLIEGVGLRQFCDLTMLLHAQKGNYDASEMEIILRKLGYFKAFLAVGAMLTKYIGLPEEEFPFEIHKRYGKWADKIMNAVLKRGNFGKFNRKHTKYGFKRSLETAKIAMGHCFTFLPLAPSDILPLIPKRISITIHEKRKGKYKSK